MRMTADKFFSNKNISIVESTVICTKEILYGISKGMKLALFHMYDNGKQKGYFKGKKEGYEEGFNNGENEGRSKGYNEGKIQGVKEMKDIIAKHYVPKSDIPAAIKKG